MKKLLLLSLVILFGFSALHATFYFVFSQIDNQKMDRLCVTKNIFCANYVASTLAPNTRFVELKCNARSAIWAVIEATVERSDVTQGPSFFKIYGFGIGGTLELAEKAALVYIGSNFLSYNPSSDTVKLFANGSL